jgi:hypothetical protein
MVENTILRFCGLWQPIMTTARPMAFRSGFLTLNLQHGQSNIKRRFVNLNDTLLQDELYPDVFYRTTQEFSAMLDRVRLK